MRIARPRLVRGFRVVREGSSATVCLEAAGIRSPRDAVSVIEPLFGDEEIEVFGVLALNTQHQVIGGPIVVTRGILNSSLVHPREVFRQALTLHEGGPAGLVLFHNHPSGNVEPSADDRAVTEQLVAAGRLLDIPVIDHVIVGRAGAGRYTSFAEAGLL